MRSATKNDNVDELFRFARPVIRAEHDDEDGTALVQEHGHEVPARFLGISRLSTDEARVPGELKDVLQRLSLPSLRIIDGAFGTPSRGKEVVVFVPYHEKHPPQVGGR